MRWILWMMVVAVGCGGPGEEAPSAPVIDEEPTADDGAEVGEGSVDGAEGDEGAAERIVRRYQGQVKYCYEAQLQTNPSLSGRVVVDLVITADVVDDVSISTNTTGDESLANCIADKVKRWKFVGVGDAEFSFPLVLQPTKVAESNDAMEGHAHGEMASDAPPLPDVQEGARVFFVDAPEGEHTSPLTLSFGIEGMEVEPAGPVNTGKGHHHLIIDGAPIAEGVVVPSDATHIHYGGGQTEAVVELTPGEHTLTLQFADGLHRSYGNAVSETVTVTIVAGG